MINLAQEQRAENGCIRVGAPSSSTSGTRVIEPGIGSTRVDPEGETTTLDESFVIVTPVADALLLFGSFGHASEHSRGIASVTICATTPACGLTTH
jgi:hypothetical protein